jgi:hypothetical protein
MAFGGVDASIGISSHATAASSGNTSSPAVPSNANYYLMGMVIVEALFLVYGRRVFRNYHGG